MCEDVGKEEFLGERNGISEGGVGVTGDSDLHLIWILVEW
jgi:hypothetical protein